MPHHCHAMWMLSPLAAALTLWDAKTRNATRLKCCADTSKVLRLLRKPHKSGAPVTQNGFLSRYEICCDVTKCHACRTQRGCATFEAFKSDHFCSTPHRHGHKDLTRIEWWRTVANGLADGCQRLRTIANGCATSSEHTLPPNPYSVKLEPLLPIRENVCPKINSDLLKCLFSCIFMFRLNGMVGVYFVFVTVLSPGRTKRLRCPCSFCSAKWCWNWKVRLIKTSAP